MTKQTIEGIFSISDSVPPANDGQANQIIAPTPTPVSATRIRRATIVQFSSGNIEDLSGQIDNSNSAHEPLVRTSFLMRKWLAKVLPKILTVSDEKLISLSVSEKNNFWLLNQFILNSFPEETNKSPNSFSNGENLEAVLSTISAYQIRFIFELAETLKPILK